MVLSLDRWVGKVAVVTGASSGIGAAIAEFLVKKGIIVAGLARRSDLIEEKSKQLSTKPGKLHAIKADVSKEEDVVNSFKWIEDNLGHVHILINSAGVSIETSLWNGDAQSWKKVLDVNVLGLCMATREAVKGMRANNIKGHVIHINSISGHKVLDLPDNNVGSASKHAVTALTGTLRNELRALGTKIKVTSLSPGHVATEMSILNTDYSQERRQMLNSAPVLKAESIAEAVGYILSTPEDVQINELTITPLGEMV